MNTSEQTMTEKAERVNKVIRLPFPQNNYELISMDAKKYRQNLDKWIQACPELFPAQIEQGYQMKDLYRSKKLDIPIRRIQVGQSSYTVHPSFVMPYLTGFVDDVETALFMRRFDVPFWALSRSFGKDPMYWYRMEQTIGRMSIVGTTVREPKDLPKDLVADEKHSWLLSEKIYIATTVGKDCILGTEIALAATDDALEKAYGVFKKEAQILDPDYAPKTVNTDGWLSTINAWCRLFPSVCLILCFLHLFIKLRDRSKKKFKDLFNQTADKLWNCYYASDKVSFAQRVRRLDEWAKKTKLPKFMLKVVEKLRNNRLRYAVAYDHPDAHRTSNMLDRLMQRMDRHLFAMQYFHGSIDSAKRSIRAWALLINFTPSNPWTVKLHGGFVSPAHRLNQFSYHEHWLHNLLISSSLGGFRTAPRKPL